MPLTAFLDDRASDASVRLPESGDMFQLKAIAASLVGVGIGVIAGGCNVGQIPAANPIDARLICRALAGNGRDAADNRAVVGTNCASRRLDAVVGIVG